MSDLPKPDLSDHVLMIGVIPESITSRHEMSDEALKKHTEAYNELRPRVLLRDQYTCQFCGWHPPSRMFMETHHLNGDHRVNTPENLITACHYCHMVHHLGYAIMCGAVVVRWDMDQAVMSRIHRLATHTQLSASRPHLIQIFNNAIREGVSRARDMLGDDVYNSLPTILQSMTADPEAYESYRRELYDQGLRLAFPPLEYNICSKAPENSEPYPISVSNVDQIREVNTEAWITRLKRYSISDNSQYVKAYNELKTQADNA